MTNQPYPEDVVAAYAEIQLSPGSGLPDVKRQYRLLVHVWHPDRLPPSLRAQGNEKLKRINAAMSVLTKFLESAASPSVAAHSDSATVRAPHGDTSSDSNHQTPAGRTPGEQGSPAAPRESVAAPARRQPQAAGSPRAGTMVSKSPKRHTAATILVFVLVAYLVVLALAVVGWVVATLLQV